MWEDYYKILGVNRNASNDDLKKAYDRLVSMWHPDNVPSTLRREGEFMFNQISEAFSVLSDPQKRQNYDLFGEEVSKTDPFQFSWKDVDEEYFSLENAGRLHRGQGSVRDRIRVKKPAVEHQLLCSLEELYQGAKKEMTISRDILDNSCSLQTIEETLTIEIKPGWKPGTKITFPEKGSVPFGIPADLVYVIDEKPHAIYKRDGNDLVLNREITVVEALTGKCIELTTLDGRILVIPLTNIVKPGHEIIVPNEGMPYSSEPRKRGNLRIKIDVAYPSTLTAKQKSELRTIFGGAS
ncbi:hypothetical protein K2173_022813 [Erythroxylum novogranatense]|uniref:J domain-containing protein n=1 Tax=Erythroxylum novogranatense TaxID=1862640 RepID=A0AAV8SMQ6_9ROSI|nr:hypothetical protein K2173_022813 [Erythroxylum novogranatense]